MQLQRTVRQFPPAKRMWSRLTLVILVTVLVAQGSSAFANPQRGALVQIGQPVTIPADIEHSGNMLALDGALIVKGTVDGAVATLLENTSTSGEVDRAPGAVMLGETGRMSRYDALSPMRHADQRIIRKYSYRPYSVRLFTVRHPLLYLLYLGGLFALALLTISLFPKQVATIAEAIPMEWKRHALLGLLALLLIVPASILVALTIVGIPLAMLLWVALFAAELFGYVAAVQLLGERLVGREAWGESRYARLAAGVLTLGLAQYVPVVGPLVSLVVAVVTLGAVLDTRFGTNKPWWPLL